MIPRYRTALSRRTLSRPVRLALDDGILRAGLTFFDYGCGKGGDVASLTREGFTAGGWDPVHAPEGKREPADVVNIGYVVNVIEDELERKQALQEAWQLVKSVLVITARLTFDELGQVLTPYRDGCLTSRGTFQKFFGHAELRAWVLQALGQEPVAAAPGTLYVFRDGAARESFLAGRQRRSGPSIRISAAARILESHREILEEITPFFSRRGRLPSVHEVPAVASLYSQLPGVGALLRELRRAVGSEAFDSVVRERRQDMLVYLALAKFSGRPSLLQKLPEDLQLDVRSLFPSYRSACDEADRLLFQVGDRRHREAAFQTACVGKLTGSALYVHVSALDRLPLQLRLYEGCARALVGSVEGTTLVKLHRIKQQVSYLSYPAFDRVAHPALLGSLVVRLGDQSVDYRDYQGSQDPPVLHRKELFVSADYPKRALFARCTAREERLGLLRDTATIGTASRWSTALRRAAVVVSGHQVKESNAAR